MLFKASLQPATTSIGENPLNAGALELMEYFKNIGIRQIIVSSSSHKIVEEAANRLGVARYMDYISGSGDNAVGSKVQRAVSVINKVTKDYSRVVAVGDTLHDCQLVSTGHQSKQDLLTTGKPVIDSLYQLKNYIF